MIFKCCVALIYAVLKLFRWFFSPTTNAIMALTVAQYLVQPFFGDEELPKEALQLIAAVFISGLTWLNCYSMKITTRLQNLFMVTKILALTLVVIVGIVALFQGTSFLHSILHSIFNTSELHSFYALNSALHFVIEFCAHLCSFFLNSTMHSILRSIMNYFCAQFCTPSYFTILRSILN